MQWKLTWHCTSTILQSNKCLKIKIKKLRLGELHDLPRSHHGVFSAASIQKNKTIATGLDAEGIHWWSELEVQVGLGSG